MDAVYWELSRLCSKGKQSHRADILAGDWNAVVGSQRQEEERIVGVYGVGTRNAKGEWLVNWASLHSLAIINTHFSRLFEDQWTYVNGGIKRQLDYFLADESLTEKAIDTQALDEIGIDNRNTA